MTDQHQAHRTTWGEPAPWRTPREEGGEAWLPEAWPPAGGGDEGWGHLPAPSRHRRGRQWPALVVALTLMVAGGVGLAIGYDTTYPPPATTPGASNGGTAGTAPGAPAGAASIARAVSPALVDIDTTMAYAGATGAGTGMVLQGDGVVLTNNHVIESATNIEVTDVGNGRTYQASVLGYDKSRDVAVLRLPGASGLHTIRTGGSPTVRMGQGVVVVGNAGGAGGAPSYAGGAVVATGQSISAVDELTAGTERLRGLIETNAPVIAGDSGGALADAGGKVVGMVTAGSAGFDLGGTGNAGYAIPIAQAVAVARQVLAGRSSPAVHLGPTAWLGVLVQIPTAPDGGTGRGAQIVDVMPGGPAAVGGLGPGDVITALGNQPVSSPEDLTTELLGKIPGSEVAVHYTDTAGVAATVTVSLGSGPAQ